MSRKTNVWEASADPTTAGFDAAGGERCQHGGNVYVKTGPGSTDWTPIADAYGGSSGGVPTSRTVTGTDGCSGGGDLSANRTISLPAVGPGAGAIGGGSDFINSITLDAKGRVTAASTGAPGGVPTSRTVTGADGCSGGGALTGDVTVTLPSVGPGAGAIGGGGDYIASITLDAKGRVTAATASTPSSGGLTEAQVRARVSMRL